MPVINILANTAVNSLLPLLPILQMLFVMIKEIISSEEEVDQNTRALLLLHDFFFGLKRFTVKALSVCG